MVVRRGLRRRPTKGSQTLVPRMWMVGLDLLSGEVRMGTNTVMMMVLHRGLMPRETMSGSLTEMVMWCSGRRMIVMLVLVDWQRHSGATAPKLGEEGSVPCEQQGRDG